MRPCPKCKQPLSWWDAYSYAFKKPDLFGPDFMNCRHCGVMLRAPRLRRFLLVMVTAVCAVVLPAVLPGVESALVFTVSFVVLFFGIGFVLTPLLPFFTAAQRPDLYK